MFFEAPPTREQPVYFPASQGKPARLGMLREMSAIEYERYLDRTVDPEAAIASAGKPAVDGEAQAPAIKAKRFEGMTTGVIDRCLFFPADGVDEEELTKAVAAARKQELKAPEILSKLYYNATNEGGERLTNSEDMAFLTFGAVQKLVAVVSSWSEAATKSLKKD